MKKLVLGALALALISGSAFATDNKRIEQWKKGEGLKFVVRDEAGQFKAWGTLELESWNDGDNRSEWVARHEDGTLVTGYKGATEKFRVGKGKESTRLVIRDKDGHFVTWADLDELLSAGWERWKRNGWTYVIRYDGKILNRANGKLEDWKGYSERVLVVRDTADDRNNGKILSWVAGKRDSRGRVHYRDPETGKFIR